ncbi:hypothetical protein F0562_029320 [Nyssa sinensis]|uniref:40S ribosomal protein S21 n=1 Tax=Nyssa sinensis TaxID=561372 RepID=A0A5J5B4P5_9ASTE|nr:hypothetical protein F0562_029320 [Nyssa sinensis]
MKKLTTPAASNGTATAGVGIGLSTGPAIVVGGAATGAGDSVPLQRTVADVLGGGKDTPVDLEVEAELLAGEALGDGPLAAGSRGGTLIKAPKGLAACSSHRCPELLSLSSTWCFELCKLGVLKQSAKMQNEEGQNVDLYIPRKCSATNRIITSKDHASVQLNIGHLDEAGRYTGQFSTFALCGFIRAQGDADSGLDRLWQKKKAEARQQ